MILVIFEKTTASKVSECGKIRTRKNSVFGHFSRSKRELHFQFSKRFLCNDGLLLEIVRFILDGLFCETPCIYEKA